MPCSRVVFFLASDRDGIQMKLSNQQAQMLLQVLSDSLKMDLGSYYSYSQSMRYRLYEDIIHQQNTEPKELQDD